MEKNSLLQVTRQKSSQKRAGIKGNANLQVYSIEYIQGIITKEYQKGSKNSVSA